MSLKAAWQAQQTAAGGFSPYGGLNEFTVSLLVVIGAAQAVSASYNDTALVTAAKTTGDGAYTFTFVSQTPAKLRGVSAMILSSTLATYAVNVIDTDIDVVHGQGGSYITIQFIDKADTALALANGTVVLCNFQFGD